MHQKIVVLCGIFKFMDKLIKRVITVTYDYYELKKIFKKIINYSMLVKKLNLVNRGVTI